MKHNPKSLGRKSSLGSWSPEMNTMIEVVGEIQYSYHGREESVGRRRKRTRTITKKKKAMIIMMMTMKKKG